jgi:ribosome-binding factor A
MEGLAAARPFLRSALARRMQLRRTPELVFEWDVGLDHARRIEELLAQVRPPEPDQGDDADDGDDADE